jgi:hypothetical protein
MTWKLIETGALGQLAAHIGTVSDVIAGHFPQKLQNKVYDASRYLCGFEIGSPKNKESLGESVIINGECFTHSTDIRSWNQGLISGPKFLSSGMFLLPSDSKATHKLQFETASQGEKLYSFYEKLYEKIKKPLIFCGFVRFQKLHTQAIAKTPIHGENIFENKFKYYSNPDKYESLKEVFLVGAITDPNDPSNSHLNQKLEVVLYYNPNEKKEGLSYHAHGLVLKQKIPNRNMITKELVEDCRHVFCEKSLVSAAELEIFTLSSIRDDYDSV